MSSPGCVRFICFFITITLCITLIIIYFVSSEKLSDDNCIPVCKSRNCIKQADILLKSINTSNDPCENFQKFLCGSYEQNAGKYEDKMMISDMSEMMMNKVKNIIENIEAEAGSAAEKLKIVYNSCVNIGSSELSFVDELRNFLNNVEIFNWPYLAPDFEFSNDGLYFLLASFMSYLQINFLSFKIETAGSNSSTSMEKYIQVYFGENHLRIIPSIDEHVAADVLDYFDLELQDIQLIFEDREIVRNALLNFLDSVNVDECENICPDIKIDCSNLTDDGWIDICKVVQIYLNITNLKPYVQSNEISVSRYSAFYVKNIISRLKSLSDRSVANYFAFNFLWQHLNEGNFFFQQKMQKYFNYFKTIFKPKMKISNRWKHCITWLSENMILVLENEFLKSYLTKPYAEEIHDIFQWHVSTINKMIDYQEWIPEKEKRNLKNKVHNAGCSIAYIQGILPNDTYVNEFLKMFNPIPSSFFHNVLEYWKSLMNSYQMFGYVDIRIAPPKFEAGANNNGGDIVFHYGFFQPPVYYPGHKKFVNDILFAQIIGHEIGHSVSGLLGTITESSDNNMHVFRQKQHCIEKQFSNFKFRISDGNLNGTRYIRENLSDNLGSAVTDKMIEELELSEEVFSLPGLTYTPKQLMYMSSRLIHCSKISEKAEMNFKIEDEHAPPEFRLIGTVQNSKEFSEIFSCPEGSYMNPREKCFFLDAVSNDGRKFQEI